MLQIRQQQVDAMQRARTAQFVRETVAHLRATLPDLVAERSDAALAEAVSEELERCRASGIESDGAVWRAIVARFRRPALA